MHGVEIISAFIVAVGIISCISGRTISKPGGYSKMRKGYENRYAEFGAKMLKSRLNPNYGCEKADGNWGSWSSYGSCSATCGGGKRRRYRNCCRKKNDQNWCIGSFTSSQTCNTKKCPPKAQWVSWSSYGKCSVTCGGGTQERSRTCIKPFPNDDGEECPGSSVSSKSCNNNGCPVDGAWSGWSPFDACTVTCGGGEKIRHRCCSNPSPAYGGKPCPGQSTSVQSCNTDKCPTDGNWASWSVYEDCSASCGGGTRERTRTCTNPAPKDGGDDCPGSPVSSQSCNTNECPVDGVWSVWSEFDTCTVTCGGGKQTRHRSCSNPPPHYGGKQCNGPSTEMKDCNTQICPTDGNWAAWSNYGSCSLSCGGGTQKRRRICKNPAPQNDGENCPGSSVSSRSCNTKRCPVNGGWSNWSSYGSCSVSCGGGKQTRTRSCTNPIPEYDGKPCEGSYKSVRECNTGICQTDGHWTSWSKYESCSASCGGGVQKRHRSCTNPAPKHGGANCVGSSDSSRKCNTNDCPADGGWSKWSEYNECSATCGGGEQTKYRSCSNPPPAYGGKLCPGSPTSCKAVIP